MNFLFKLKSNSIFIPNSYHNLIITKYIGRNNHCIYLNKNSIKYYPYLNHNYFYKLLNNNYHYNLPLDIYNEYNHFCFDHNLNLYSKTNCILLSHIEYPYISWNIKLDDLDNYIQQTSFAV